MGGNSQKSDIDCMLPSIRDQLRLSKHPRNIRQCSDGISLKEKKNDFSNIRFRQKIFDSFLWKNNLDWMSKRSVVWDKGRITFSPYI